MTLRLWLVVLLTFCGFASMSRLSPVLGGGNPRERLDPGASIEERPWLLVHGLSAYAPPPRSGRLSRVEFDEMMQRGGPSWSVYLRGSRATNSFLEGLEATCVETGSHATSLSHVWYEIRIHSTDELYESIYSNQFGDEILWKNRVHKCKRKWARQLVALVKSEMP